MSIRKGPLERDIQRDVMAALGRMAGVVVNRNNVGVAVFETDDGRRASVAYGVGGKGAPDLLVEVRVGGEDSAAWLAVWMETKTDVGALSKDQQAWHEAARRRGRHVYVVRTVTEALDVLVAVGDAHRLVVADMAGIDPEARAILARTQRVFPRPAQGGAATVATEIRDRTAGRMERITVRTPGPWDGGEGR